MEHLKAAVGKHRAGEILAAHQAKFPSREAYFSYLDSINAEGDRITYREDGRAAVTL